MSGINEKLPWPEGDKKTLSLTKRKINRNRYKLINDIIHRKRLQTVIMNLINLFKNVKERKQMLRQEK